MIKRRFTFAATLLAGASLFLSAPESSHAAFDYYIKIGDIEGEVADTQHQARHKDWIQILSLHTGDLNIGVGEHGIGVGELQEEDKSTRESGEKGGTEDINIGVGELQEDDGSTVDYWKGLFDTADNNVLTLVNKDGEDPDFAPLFREAMANNGVFDDLVVIAGINGNSCKISLRRVEIIGYNWRSPNESGDIVPTEQFSFNFEEIKFEVVETNNER